MKKRRKGAKRKLKYRVIRPMTDGEGPDDGWGGARSVIGIVQGNGASKGTGTSDSRRSADPSHARGPANRRSRSPWMRGVRPTIPRPRPRESEGASALDAKSFGILHGSVNKVSRARVGTVNIFLTDKVMLAIALKIMVVYSAVSLCPKTGIKG